MKTSPGAISARVERIVAGNDPEFLAELPSGFAILGKYQPEAVRGAVLFAASGVRGFPTGSVMN